MKRILQFIAASMLLCASNMAANAQSPQYVNYQAIARNNSGAPITNASVAIRVSIRNASASGAVVYAERDTATTNAHGLFTCKIGAGNIISGTFAGIDWANGDKYMQVELDPTGGSTYTDMGTTQLLSVPYALHSEYAVSAQNAVSAQSATTATTATTAQTAASALVADTVLHLPTQPWTAVGNNIYSTNISGFVGIGTVNPTQKLEVIGIIRTTALQGDDVNDLDITNAGNILFSSTSGTYTWTTGGAERFRIQTDGKLGIKNQSPTHDISLNDEFGGRINIGNHGGWTAIGFANSANGPYNAIANGGTYLSFLYAANSGASLTSKMLMDGGGNVFRPTNDNQMSLGASGYRWTAVYATNGAIQTSDERYKQNVTNLNYGLNEVMQLRPVSYQWKDKNLQLGTGTNLGFVAQELERIVPDLVIHNNVEPDAETGKINNSYNDAYGVKYVEFIPVLTKAIQEQQALIEELKKEIEALKKR